MPSIHHSSRKLDLRLWTFVVLLAAMWALVLVVLLTPEAPNGHGLEHSRFATMNQGGDGAARHESFVLTGWALGSVVIAIFVCLLAWGTLPPRRAGATQSERAGRFDSRWMGLIIGGLIYEGVFGMMCLSYWKSLTDTGAPFAGPFPAALSWLLFGVWLVPGVFITLYVIYFERWIWPPENAQRFAELTGQLSTPED